MAMRRISREEDTGKWHTLPSDLVHLSFAPLRSYVSVLADSSPDTEEDMLLAALVDYVENRVAHIAGVLEVALAEGKGRIGVVFEPTNRDTTLYNVPIGELVLLEECRPVSHV